MKNGKLSYRFNEKLATTGANMEILDSTDTVIAICYDDEQREESTARLFAASPDLLSACQSALAMLRDPDADTDEANELEAILIAAIKKASE